MGSTAPPRACARSSLVRVSATACATRSPSSRSNWWPSRRLSVRHSARSSTPGVQGMTAEGPAGVCAGPTAASHCGPRRPHGWSGQRRTRAALVPGQQGGLVRGARRPSYANDQHAAGSGPSRYRPETLDDERVPSSPRESIDVSSRAGTPVQPGPLPASRQARRPLWCGSGRRAVIDSRRVAQSPAPHLGRLSVSRATLHH
jgi:hypothetical protein